MDPLLVLLESVHGGVKGRVVDQDGEILSEAAIKVQFKDYVKVISWNNLLPLMINT